MTNKQTIFSLQAAALCLSAMTLQTSALAYYDCPVGVNPGEPNNTGVACSWIEEEAEPEYEEAAPEYAPEPQLPIRRYTDEEINAALTLPADELMSRLNPQPAPVRNGWNFSQAPVNDRSQGCSATFTAGNSSVLFMDTVGPERKTLLGFYGGSIPPTQTARNVKLSLTQSGETQVVRATHVPSFSDPQQGMYIFNVPNTEALLNSIEDRQDYTIALNGKIIVQGEWVDGTKARNWLSQCVKKRGS